MEFQKITLESIPVISEYLSQSRFGICDYTAPTVYMWRNYFETEYAVSCGMLFLRHKNFNGKTAYLFPVGTGDEKEALKRLFEEHGSNMTFCVVPEQKLDFLIEFGDRYCGRKRLSVENDIDWNDYIYLPEKIIGFPGKKLHGQKNHFNFFNKNFPDCTYTELCAENADRVRDFVLSMGLSPEADEVETTEYTGTLEFLREYKSFPMSCGGFLELDGKIIAAAVAERQTDYLIIHIEKADRSYRGAYQKIFHELVSRECNGLLFVNREEDCGDEGMRYAKSAYHPEKLLKKYTVSFS